MLAIDGVRLPRQFAGRIDGDGVRPRLRSGDEVRSRNALLHSAVRNSGLPRVRLHRNTSDDPRVGVERLRRALVLGGEAGKGTPVRRDDSAVDRRAHVADDVGTLCLLHGEIRCTAVPYCARPSGARWFGTYDEGDPKPPGQSVADLLTRLRLALADRYTIERELGSGGMATVYLAQDVKHHRQVAIKVLKPELGVAGHGEVSGWLGVAKVAGMGTPRRQQSQPPARIRRWSGFQ